MATMLRSSSAAIRRLLLVSRATYSSFAAVRSTSYRAIPAVASSHRISVELCFSTKPYRIVPHFHSSRIRKISGSMLPSSWQPCRTISFDSKLLPEITDPEIESAFKDLMATSWDHIPESVVSEAKKAASKETSDELGQKHLKGLFAAAEACEEFSGTLVSLRMALDDLGGITGENVGPLPAYIQEAVKAAHNRYMTYLNSFGPDETYLRKKVETELGTKMIHLKMRCSGIGSEWGQVSLLGTSGISGSYVELRS